MAVRETFFFWKKDWIHVLCLPSAIAILFLPVFFGIEGAVQMSDEWRFTLSVLVSTLLIVIATFVVKYIQMPEILRKRKIEKAAKCRVLIGTGTALADITSIDKYQGGPEAWEDHYECWIVDVGLVLSVKQRLRFMSAIPDGHWHNGFWLQANQNDNTYQNMWKDLRGKMAILTEIESAIRNYAEAQETSSLYSTFLALRSKFIASLKIKEFSRLLKRNSNSSR